MGATKKEGPRAANAGPVTPKNGASMCAQSTPRVVGWTVDVYEDAPGARHILIDVLNPAQRKAEDEALDEAAKRWDNPDVSLGRLATPLFADRTVG